MKCSIKQQQTTIGYNSIPHAIVEAGTAAVPFGTTLLPSSTTTTTMTLGRRSLMLLLVGLAGGGTIWLWPDGEMSAAKGLVVATAGIAELCYPDTYNAWGAFGGGVSTTTTRRGEDTTFETCLPVRLKWIPTAGPRRRLYKDSHDKGHGK